jgi:hypothetical protein
MDSRWSRSSSCCSSGVSISRLLLDRAGPLDDLGGEPPLAGLQDPAVGIGEASEGDGQQRVEGALGLVEPRLELSGHRPEGRDNRVAGRGQRAARIAQQRLAGGAVGARDPPGRQEPVGLARAQAVAHDGLGQARLLGAREGGEALRGRRGDSTRIDVRRQDRREPPTEGHAALHPAAAAAQQLADLRGGELVVVRERADHARLIHRAQRAARGIGLEQARLAHDAGRVLDDRRHVGVAVGDPARHALEPVEDLVAAGLARGDAHGQRGERARRISPRPAQGRQRGREVLDRQVEDPGHGCTSSRGNSWESG